MEKRYYFKAINSRLTILAIAFIMFACSKDEEPVIVIEKLESSSIVFGRTQNEMSNLVQLAGYNELDAYLNYDITIYEITYKTQYKGEEIIASGLVTFPETDQAVPMMSFQHGTMVAHDDAPTEDIATYSFLSSVASAGYIFLIPDFIGFGSSIDKLHPYYHEELTASSVIDMMKAAKELAFQEGYNFDGQVFLSGYSEGGYATMATHKALEENPISGFELVASAPSSGGYDIKGMQEYFFALETYHQPFYIAYVALSYYSVYDWTIPLTTFFQEPYASELEGYFDGSMTGGEINILLTEDLSEYLNPDMVTNFDSDATYVDFVDAFNENSTHNWAPKIRMMLYHGTSDITVPYQNSVDTYNSMLDLGASNQVVTFTSLEGHTHTSGFFPYLYDFLEKFEELK